MRQRFVLIALASFGLLGVFGDPVSAGADKEPPKRRIYAISHGARIRGDKEHLHLKFLIALTGKEKPRICFLPTATGDSAASIERWYETMGKLPCLPRHQRMFISASDTKDFETELLEADALFVAGGNTLNMLAIWKAQGVDRLLRKAYDKGIILAGESAGALCWFENGTTDSRPGKITALECLGVLQGSFCPHYDGEKERRPIYHELIQKGVLKEGIAADEHVGLVFENEKLVRIVTSRPGTFAYRVRKMGETIHEDKLKPEMLGK